MIRYVAKGKSAWEPVSDDPHKLKEIQESGKHEFMTVLAVSEIVNEETTDYDELKYKGPLYFDIDVEGNIEKATESTQTLVETLQAHGVLDEYILVFATGSKGYHILVHQKAFSSGRAIKNLPTIYKEIATKFAVEGLDFVVYSEKRGRMWRIPNFKRSNGKYKVSITLEELFDITVEKYQSYISAPRKVLRFPESITVCSKMKKVFEDAKKTRLNKIKNMTNSKGLGLEEFKVMEGEIPACIQQVKAWEGLNPAEHFNNIILQTVTYLKAAELPKETVDPLIDEIAANSTSHRYPNQNDRRREIASKYSYVNKSDYKFDCNYMRSVLDESPCKGCKLEFVGLEGVEEGEEGQLGITTTNKGYFRGDSQISTFVLNPVNRYLDCDSAQTDITVGMEVQVMVDNKIRGIARLTEDAFQSKTSMLQQLQGQGDAVFLGNDTDVQKIKHNLFNVVDRSEIGDIVETFTAGVMETKRGSRTLVYVEQDFSIDQYKTVGTHMLLNEPTVPPELRKTNLPAKENLKEIREVLKTLFLVNTPTVVAQILGWASACHLKTHFSCGVQGAREFPLLMLTGNAGTGKTQSAGLFMNLHCTDYLVKDSPPSLASITEWALIEICSSTTTTPRVLDEFNKAKMGIKKYNSASEIMKMSWGSQTINRGTISKGSGIKRGRTGARTISIPITSPLLALGEQEPTEPAILQRSCVVNMKRSGRLGREDEFRYCVKNTEHIREVGKAMVFQSLRKPLEYAHELREKYSDQMPDSFEPRARITYQIILGGLDFFEETLEVIGIDLKEEIDELRQSFIRELDLKSEELSSTKALTEVDRAIMELAIVALQTKDSVGYGGTRLTRGEMYLRTDNYLYMDLPICHSMFVSHMRISKKTCVIDNAVQMKKMLMEEDYCISTEEPCSENAQFAGGRNVAKLDIKMMKEKGIEADYYYFGDEFTDSAPRPFIADSEVGEEVKP